MQAILLIKIILEILPVLEKVEQRQEIIGQCHQKGHPLQRLLQIWEKTVNLWIKIGRKKLHMVSFYLIFKFICIRNISKFNFEWILRNHQKNPIAIITYCLMTCTTIGKKVYSSRNSLDIVGGQHITLEKTQITLT